jgi:LCP family protein required for cell wall assembly
MTRRRALVRLLVVPPLCGVLVGALVAAAWLAVGHPAPATGAVWLQVTRTGEAHFRPAPTQPFFFLALGNDARSDADPGLGDAIHVIGINPAQGAGTIIDIPRDTEGPNGSKINSYNSLAGLRAMADAVGQLLGIPIPFAITTNFDHFIAMVDAIGGVDINVPTDMIDSDSEADFRAGPQHMDGFHALAFTRDRKSFASGDITRTANQGLMLLSVLSSLEKKQPSAGDTVHMLAVFGHHVRLDGVHISDLFHLARYALTLDPARIRNEVIPVANAGGTNLAPTGDARALFQDFADDAILENH